MNIGSVRYLLSRAPFNSKTQELASIMGLAYPRWNYTVAKMTEASMYASTILPYHPEIENKLIPGIRAHDDSLLVLSQQAAPQRTRNTPARFPLEDPVVCVDYVEGTLLLSTSSGYQALDYEYDNQDGATLLKVEWPAHVGELGAIRVPDAAWQDKMSFKFSTLESYPSEAVVNAVLENDTCFEFLNKQGYVEAVFQHGHPDEQVAIIAAAICKSLI